MQHIIESEPKMVKWTASMAFAALLVIGLAWPTAATSPYTRILIEDGSPYFIPAAATVTSGSPIHWENPTPTHHTITHLECLEEDAACRFDSGTMPPGASFTLPGLPPGRYVYHCRIHPVMRGVLTVTESSPLPSQL